MRPWGARIVAVLGWVLLAAGACVLLYLVYALAFTGVEAERAQSALRTQWAQRTVEPAADPTDGRSTRATVAEPSEPQVAGSAAPDDAGDPQAEPDPEIAAPDRGVALLTFSRPGGSDTLVHDEPLVVLDDVTLTDLQQGPGHYPDTALPGESGNFAVAGHRTTYGAPFYHLDVLRRGDQVLVTDREGRRHTYAVAEQRVVLPVDTWVIGDDPLGSGKPTLTLTTCNPRFSAAERLVVHAELVS